MRPDSGTYVLLPQVDENDLVKMEEQTRDFVANRCFLFWTEVCLHGPQNKSGSAGEEVVVDEGDDCAVAR